METIWKHPDTWYAWWTWLVDVRVASTKKRVLHAVEANLLVALCGWLRAVGLVDSIDTSKMLGQTWLF